MAVKTYTFEGGTDGSAVLAADTGNGDQFNAVVGPPSGGVFQYTTASSAVGSKAGRFANRATGGDNYVSWTASASAGTYYGRIYFMVDALNQGMRLMQARDSVGNIVGSIWLNSTPNIRITSPADAALWTDATTLTLNQWYRCEWQIVTTSTTAATIRVVLYLGDSTTSIADSGAQAVTWAGAAATWNTVRYGINDSGATITNAPTATSYIYLDALTAFDTAFSGPAQTVSTTYFVRYRIGKNVSSGTLNFTVSLVQGTTVIATWLHPNIQQGFTTYVQQLTTTQVAAITDTTNLRLRFVTS